MMMICLKTLAKQDAQQVVLKVTDRLPEHLEAPFELHCEFQVTRGENHYVLALASQGQLKVICQRCLHPFQHEYTHQTKLAVCADEAEAERLMEHMESMVVANAKVDLLEVLADELHLFAPEKHAHLTDCDPYMTQFIEGKCEIVTTTLGLQRKTR